MRTAIGIAAALWVVLATSTAEATHLRYTIIEWERAIQDRQADPTLSRGQVRRLESVEKLIQKLDRNEDGLISKEEKNAGLRRGAHRLAKRFRDDAGIANATLFAALLQRDESDLWLASLERRLLSNRSGKKVAGKKVAGKKVDRALAKLEKARERICKSIDCGNPYHAWLLGISGKGVFDYTKNVVRQTRRALRLAAPARRAIQAIVLGAEHPEIPEVEAPDACTMSRSLLTASDGSGVTWTATLEHARAYTQGNDVHFVCELSTEDDREAAMLILLDFPGTISGTTRIRAYGPWDDPVNDPESCLNVNGDVVVETLDAQRFAGTLTTEAIPGFPPTVIEFDLSLQ